MRFEENKIYNMDCVDGLRDMDSNSIDLVITSPPYNQRINTQSISRQYSSQKVRESFAYADNMSDEEYTDFMTLVFDYIFLALKSTGSFFYNYKSQNEGNVLKLASEHVRKMNKNAQFKTAAEIIWKYAGNWDLHRTRFPTDYEYFFHLVKQPEFKFSDCNKNLTSVWKIRHVMAGSAEKAECGSHPCPFPVEIARRIIEHTTDVGDLVLDPFMGSGTVAVACKQLERNFIGFEISSEYCEIARKRLEQKTLRNLLDVKVNG